MATKKTICNSPFSTFKYILKHFSKNRKKQFIILLFLMLLGGMAEAFSLSLVVPFLTLITAGNEALINPELKTILLKIRIVMCPLTQNNGSGTGVVGTLAIIFVLTALVAGIVRVMLVWFNAKFSANLGTDLGAEVYKRTLYQPYAVHLSRNSADLISSLVNKISILTVTISSWLNIMTSIIVIGFIVCVLLYANPLITFLAGLSLGCCYFIVTYLGNKKMKKNSAIINYQQNVIIKTLQEGLGGIREVLLNGTQEYYKNLFSHADKFFRNANASVLIAGLSPRFIMESLGMSFFALTAVYFSDSQEGLNSAIPILGALAIGIQRLLPAAQQLYQSWTGIVAYQNSNYSVLKLLNQKYPEWVKTKNEKPFIFQKEIRFSKVCFRFKQNTPWILKKLSLRIKKGSCIGFVGRTGSGKTTCLDLLMGLLNPTSGRISIDGMKLEGKKIINWQKNIAHVPQTIFLADSSLAENIAFGVPLGKIDMDRVEKAAEQAELKEFIDSSPNGYGTIVGERGIRLSGGQRQRIGIARALYKDAEVLVFDEATSALDHETEKTVMKTILSLGSKKTILIIAHRLSTLKNCSQIIELKNNRVIRKEI